MATKQYTWSNWQEKLFLDQLGKYTHKGQIPLLEGYLEGCTLRKEWGDLAPAQIIEYATVKLALCRVHEQKGRL